ncbi:MAG: NAD(+) synthase, partial [Clostridia bacterium]|nr:NAD(+) synthase [Clostridia bacterium]
KADSVLCFDGENIPFSNRLIFCHSVMENYSFGIEIGEDLFASVSPASELCANGADIILNPSSSNETTGKAEQRKLFIKTASAKNICAYITSNASMGEATGDTVFSAHNIIAENGSILCESAPFEMKNAVSEIDVNKLSSARVKSNLFRSKEESNVQTILFEQEIIDTSLSRKFALNPFVPENKTELNEKIETILKIQAFGLKKRLEHARSGSAVIGISGGLDSCLALLATVNAFDLIKADRKKIIAVTMPCFGTSERTHDNAVKMCESLGVTLREVNIKEAVNIHFRDIEHSSDVHDVTYENAQARERTQVLMDIANKENGMVIGTGDLSELALGWATYNGDHMSMYSVNADITKTMVRHIVQHIAENSENALKEVLLDILDTPVSPELLPTDNQGKIAQKTEDLVGPYELHDFFLYHHIENAFSPSKIYRIAKYTFDSIYDSETILKWLRTFMRRFFIQQFKRSCLPDGPKTSSVSLSPRGDWNMPSDASFEMWVKDLENIG